VHTPDALPSGCLICRNTHLAVVAVFQPDGRASGIPYAICTRCWDAFSPPVIAGLVEQLLTERTP
jgi:hypothetical protein